MKIKQKTVADKVHELLAKQSKDSEDETSAEETEPKVTEFDDDDYELPQAQTTEFRKRNIKLLSEQSAKYKGKISSRKELQQDSEDEADYYENSDTEEEEEEEAESNEDDDDDDDDEVALKAFGDKLTQISNGHTKQNDSEEDEDEEDDDEEALKAFGADLTHLSNAHNEQENSEEDEEEDDDDDESEEDSQEIVTETNRQAEMQKGICVQNQLRIWEKLLEMRIQTQKILSKANQLPPPDELQTIANKEEVQKTAVSNVTNLVDKLLELQQTLSQQYPEIREAVKPRQKRTKGRDEDQPACKRLNTELDTRFTGFRSYRDNVLLKWDDRTKLMTPGAGNKRKSGQEDYDILKKISHALSSRQTLIERSQILKSNKMEKELDTVEDEKKVGQAHVYDDSDFYHQQLRELIEYKANTTSNMSEVTKQYVELQKYRQKMKKKVDTRASKGRKLRYLVHNKLVNFMAPQETSSWTDESKDELYKSLFAA